MIRNLLFDLGGVIMDIDKDRCVRAFEALGLPDARDYFGDYVQQPPFATLESGQIGPDEFHAILRGLITGATDAQIDAAFTQFLLGIPVGRLHDLEKLRSHYRVYLLSNTNPVMWNGFISEQFRQDGKDIDAYFDGVVTSFEAKCMKPGAEIFDYASRKYGIVPAETLFLDDSLTNCQAAEALGWHAAHVRPGSEFGDILSERGLL